MSLVVVNEPAIQITALPAEVNGVTVSQEIKLLDLSAETVELTINEQVVLINRTAGLITEQVLLGQPLFIQDAEPTFPGQYLWVQTNVGGNPDNFSFFVNL